MIKQAIGPHEDLLTILRRCKLKWYGHITVKDGKDKVRGKADKKRSGKTTSKSGQAWSLPSPRGQWRTKKNGGTVSEVICDAKTGPMVKG